jgi:uncharacterized protein (TIGR03545 family)
MKKEKKIRIAPLFRKKYTEKNYRKKILKKLFIPADRELVESLFITVKDPKKGTDLYTIDTVAVKDPKQARRLALIAKQIKKQKGRFNIVSIVMALVCVVALCLALTVFRNVIARIAVTSAFEGTFGAKCDIRDIDFNIPKTYFRIDGLAVANRASPMKNLFEIGRCEIHFDLLELSRGKFVADNVEFTGVTWNTDRKKSGALPPKKQKQFEKKQKNAKPNPVTQALQKEVTKLSAGVSVDSGIAAVKDQLDPTKFIEKEKAGLKSPAEIQKIMDTVPALTTKWTSKTDEARSKVDSMIAQGKKLSTLKVDSIRTVEEVQALIPEIKAASDTAKETVAYVQTTVTEVNADAKTVTSLAGEADSAVRADAARLGALVDTIKSINIDTGKGLISGVFQTFIVNTLGAYYPYIDKGITTFGELQSATSKTKKQSLKQKSKFIERLPGRDFDFSHDSMPSFLMKNIALSASDGASGIAGKATLQNITNDADKIGKPVTVALAVSHGGMSENLDGILDFRSAAKEIAIAKFTGKGYPVALSAGNVAGVPSISGSLSATGNVAITANKSVHIESALLVSDAKATVAAFEPEFLHDAYANVLASITRIDLGAVADITADKGLSLKVDTDIDSVLRDAVQKEIARQVEQFKAEIRRAVEDYIAQQKTAYTGQIAQFTAIYDKSKKTLDDAKNYEQILQAKKAELEHRIQAIADEKAAELKKMADAAAAEAAKKAAEAEKAATDAANAKAAEATEAAKKTAADKMKKLF